jgi:recombinational DNA repair ATPase RecF
LTEWKRLHSLVENRVLMHIDDLAVHLDKQRKELLQKSLDKLSQIFITSPHENNWSDCFSSGKIFTISNGKFISSDKF